MPDITTTSKSWFQKTEGKYGTGFTIGFIALVAGLGIYFWGIILPFLLMVVTNTIYLLGGCVVLGLFGLALLDPRWRMLGIYGYKSLMRGMTSLFVEIDPIGILQTYVSRLRDRLEDMDKSIGNLRGQIQKLKVQISRNEEQRVHSLEIMAQAKGKENAKTAFVLQSRQAGRLEKSNLTLTDLLTKMEALLRVLSKMREASSMMVEDIDGEVKVKTDERKALLAGYGAFTAAKKILQGGGDEREMFDQTMEHLATDYGNKIGEIENFMDVSRGFIEGVDLENGVFEANALKQLEMWEQRTNTLLDGPSNVRVDVGQSTTPEIPQLSPPITNADFADLFEPGSRSQVAKKQ